MRKERRTFDTLHGHPGLLRYAANPVRGCFRQVEGGSVSLPRCTRRNGVHRHPRRVESAESNLSGGGHTGYHRVTPRRVIGPISSDGSLIRHTPRTRLREIVEMSLRPLFRHATTLNAARGIATSAPRRAAHSDHHGAEDQSDTHTNECKSTLLWWCVVS